MTGFRAAEAADVPAVAALAETAFVDYPLYAHLRPYLRREEDYGTFLRLIHVLVTRVHLAQGEVLLAETDGQLQGFLLAHRRESSLWAYLRAGGLRLLTLFGPLKLVGCLRDLFAMGMMAEVPEDCLYIEVLAVAPDWQGHHLGSHLLEQAESLARRQGLSRLALSTNTAANVAFYQKRGFAVTEEVTYTGLSKWGMVKVLD